MDVFSISLNMKVFCLFSLESPHRGDSNEYTQYTIFNIYHCSCWILSKGLKNEFETPVVNEPSVFEPLKVFCIIFTSDVRTYLNQYHMLVFCFCCCCCFFVFIYVIIAKPRKHLLKPCLFIFVRKQIPTEGLTCTIHLFGGAFFYL